MLRIVHTKLLHNADFDTLPLVKNFHIESPLAMGVSPKQQASLINESLRVLGPYIAQYDLDTFIAYRTAITHTADVSNNGAIYLLSGRSRQYDMTGSLKKLLPADVAADVLDFTVYHQRTKLFSKIQESPEEGAIAHKDMFVHQYALTDNYTSRVLSPAVVLHQMYDQNVAPGATTTKLVELSPLLARIGFSFDTIPDKRLIFMDQLYQNAQVLPPHVYDKVSNIVTAIYKTCYEPYNPKINSHIKDAIGKLGASLISANTPYYHIHYNGEKIGMLGQMTNHHWILAQENLSVPMNLNSISTHFPNPIRALLPERRVRNGLPCSINETDLPDLIAEKPLLMNNLSVRNPLSPNGKKLLAIDTLSLSLLDMPKTLILEGDTLDIISAHEGDPSRRADTILGDVNTPSIAGAQAKVPVNLSGTPSHPLVKVAGNGDFTHILKVHNDNDPKKKAMIYCEAFGMLASRAINIPTAPFKLMGSDVINESSVTHNKNSVVVSRRHPSIIIERFDINHVDAPAGTYKFNEELVSVARCGDKAYTGKGNAIHGIDVVADTVSKHSTNWNEDKKVLFKAALLNTLIGNIDAHLKNWSLLHTVCPDGTRSTRLSPAYDIVAVRCCDPYYFNSSGLCQISEHYHTTKKQVMDFGTIHCDLSAETAQSLYVEVTQSLIAFMDDCKSDPAISEMFKLTELGTQILSRCLRFTAMTLAHIDNDVVSDVESDFKRVFATEKSLDACNAETDAIIEQIEYRDSQDALEKLTDIDNQLNNWLSEDDLMDHGSLFKLAP